MAATSFYLDARRVKKDGTCPLKINISKDSKTCYISLNVSLRPEHWDARANKVIGRSDKQYLNTVIYRYKQDIDDARLELMRQGKVRNSTAPQLKEMILTELDPDIKREKEDAMSFSSVFRRFTDHHNKASTRTSYELTYKHIQKFVGEDISRLKFEDISKDWLQDFDNYLSKTSPSKNARNIHLRNIRAVFNYAIDIEVTNNYPFRRFPIKSVETAKRSLPIEQLRMLFSYPCEEWQQPYVDMFKLIFFLCGINVIDLFNLKEIVNGRIGYHRSKTNKLYSIKVEPEAMEIIDKYRGKTALLNLADRYTNHLDYIRRPNKTVQHIGEYRREGRGGKKVYTPIFPHISTYWMRHSWAPIAADLDIPDDTISRALGHSITSGARVTQVYINFNNRKIDEANRKVIDYVLYDKK